MKTDNSTASEIANDTICQHQSRAMDMRFYWVRHWVRHWVRRGHFLSIGDPARKIWVITTQNITHHHITE